MVPTTVRDASQMPDQPSVAPTTTVQQDITEAGRRQINVIWERTQQTIAIAVTIIVLLVCSYLVVNGPPDLRVPAFVILSNVFFLVVGTYFQRTNHTKVGGVGPGPPEATR